MGIKFLCPNGHKLNVKSFLSGKKAICPKCGARVLVPSESTFVGEAAEGESQTLSALPVAAVESGERSPAEQSPATASAVVPPAIDPLDESLTAVWYVRPASGGQFGPASGEIMRNWLAEGRIGASSLVWRAGWSEWQSAAAVFPQLASLLASPEVAAAVGVVQTPTMPPGIPGSPPPAGSLSRGEIVQPESALAGGAPVAARPNAPLLIPDDMLTAAPRRRRRRNDKSILASAVLAIVIVVLLVVLFVIARRSSSTDDTSTSTSAASDER